MASDGANYVRIKFNSMSKVVSTWSSCKSLWYFLWFYYRYRLKSNSEKKKYLRIIGKFIDKYICFGKFTIQRPKMPKHFTVLFLSFEPIYRAIFTLASALGLFFHVYFYTFCLIYILLRNDILKDILSSVRAAGWCIILFLL